MHHNLLHVSPAGMTIRVRVGDNKPPQGPISGGKYQDGGYTNGYYLGNSLCTTIVGGAQTGDPTVLTCAQLIVGRYLTLQLEPSAKVPSPVLVICELQVFGSEWQGHFGLV
jgi:hypothetical protein